MAAAAVGAGSPIALNYGYCWLTGTLLGSTTLQNTGSDDLDYTRIGGYALGDGEMDGLERFWETNTGRLLYTSEFDDLSSFHFHRGCDAVIGSGLAPSSSGPDQGVDSFFQYMPSGIQPLTYNRIASYWFKLKLFVNNPANDHQYEPGNFTDIAPIGLWRGMRVRLFDDTGAMTGYAFSTNPTAIGIDIILRRRLFREYNIDLVNGADDLPSAVRNRFDWVAMADHAAICDVDMGNGHRQFETNLVISQPGTMQSCLSTVLQGCRSYFQERNGKISFVCDQARASVFTFSRQNTLSFTADDKDLHTAPNRIIGQYRDIEIPVAATIASISFPDHQAPIITTEQPHPCASGDRIVIGGTDTTYDTSWVVDTVPDGDEVYTMTLKTRGSNYPTSVGAGGKLGLEYSRFKQRAPEFNHHRNQLAKGAIGVGIPRQRNKVDLTIDFATSNYDLVSRISRYERDRALGVDSVPYVTPVVATVVIDRFALDAAGSGNVAEGIDPGDRVTIDDTLTYTMPGDYEVIDADVQPDSAQQGSLTAGTITVKLGPYNPSILYSSSDPSAAGYQTVPGSAPGNNGNYAEIPLEDGFAVFFTGGQGDGDTLSLPSLGLNPADFIGWCSPQGHIDGDEHLHFIQLCDIDVNRQTTMVWSSDVGVTWKGDVSTAGVAWRTRTSATAVTAGAMNYVELTLAGGEKVIFGRGVIADGGAVTLPPLYTSPLAIMLGFMRDGTNTDHPAHGCRAYVDTSGNVHMDYQDGEGNVWHGNVVPFVFAVQDNMNTWTQSGGWLRCPLGTTGKTLAIGGFSILDARLAGSAPMNFPTTLLTTVTDGKLPLPGDLPQATLQMISGVNSFVITDNDAHGVKECYVDGELNSLAAFEDGDGNVWAGSAGVFALLCDTSTGGYSGSSVRLVPDSRPATSMPDYTAPTSGDAILTPDGSDVDGVFTMFGVDVEIAGTGYTPTSTASASDGTTTVALTLTLGTGGSVTDATPASPNPTFTAAPTITVTR